MVEITIHLGGTTIDEYVKKDEDGPACPTATVNSEVNDKNMAKAAEECEYRKPDDGGFINSKPCATCAAYNITPEIKRCVDDDSGDRGYCQTHQFVCGGVFTCTKWVKGGPLDGLAPEEADKAIETEPRDVF